MHNLYVPYVGNGVGLCFIQPYPGLLISGCIMDQARYVHYTFSVSFLINTPVYQE